MEKFKIGDVVRLNSGGLKMIVQNHLSIFKNNFITEMNKNTKVNCIYSDGSIKKNAMHHEDVLE